MRRRPSHGGVGSTGDLFLAEVPPAAPTNTHPNHAPRTSRLWLALEFPQLPAVVIEEGVDSPVVVVDGPAHAEVVVACNRAARAVDIQMGMRLGIARLRSDVLRVITRRLDREQAYLGVLARQAQRFTPFVSLEPPQALLLEIKGSRALFGGLNALCETVREYYRSLGHEVHDATAVTARGALWLARTEQRLITETQDALRQHLAVTAIEVAQWPASVNALCERIGVRLLGELRRLPREGLAARLGLDTLRTLDEAHGDRPEARRRHVVAERFSASLDLPAETHSAQCLLPASDHLLASMESFLRRRDSGVMQLTLRCLHRAHPATLLRLGRAWPSARADEWRELVSERLPQLRLAAPTERLQLRSGPCLPLETLHRDLPGHAPTIESAAFETTRLLERLRARLGDDAVQGMRLIAEHRPERAYRHQRPETSVIPTDLEGLRPLPPRPLWLVDPPKPLQLQQGRPWLDGPLVLTRGPERIESGWWDGDAIARDYYVAAAQRGRQLWIFRTRLEDQLHWFLHGVFA